METSLFTVKVANAIEEINRKDWDSIFPKTLEGYPFFKTIDETLQSQFKPYYIAIYEGSSIVCAAPGFIMDYPLETTVEGWLKKAVSWLNRVFPNILTLRTFICGCPACEGRIGISGASRKTIMETLVKTIRAISGEKKTRVIAFKDFSAEFTADLDLLLPMGFRKIRSYPSVELEIRFNSFEEYLASLSRVTRKGLKKKFRNLESGPKIEIEVASGLGELLDEAYQLYMNTLEKSNVQFECLSKEFFSAISRNMPEETKYFLWRIDGRLVAFNLCLTSDGVLIDEYIGMDYNVAYKFSLYYVTFRDILIWCMKNGIKRYESGALNYDPKKRLDFKFIPEFIYFRHLNGFLNLLLGCLFRIFKPENFDPVFKLLPKDGA